MKDPREFVEKEGGADTWNNDVADDVDVVRNRHVAVNKKSTSFSLQIFHGGKFSKSPNMEYRDGEITFIDDVNLYDITLRMLDEMVKSIGYPCDMEFFYQFKEPYVCLDLGLKSLKKDDDFDGLCKQVREGYKVIEIFVEKSMENEEVSYDDIVDLNNPMHEKNEVVDMVNYNSCVRNGNESESESEDLEVDHDNFDSQSDEETTILKRAGNIIRSKRKRKTIGVDASVNPFYIGQLIEDKEKLNEMVKSYSVASRRDIYILKNELLKYRLICVGTNPNLVSGGKAGSNLQSGVKLRGVGVKLSNGEPKKPNKRNIIPTCPWAIHISRSKPTDNWCVKTISGEHNCLQTREVAMYTRTFIAKEIQPMVESNPEIPLTAIQDVIQKKHQIQVSLHKVSRAKKLAKQKIHGHYQKQYTLLRAYCEELLKANPGSTIKIDVEPLSNPSSSTRQFRRVYICFHAMKRGFKMCGRDIIGLDGCFMKGPYPGQILSAVGVDSNNGIYPVAYSLVEAETNESWAWFLDLLKDDLDLSTNSNFTFISDRQKGLIPALKRVFPSAEHRFCLRHIHENMKKEQWRGDLFKNLLWRAASATTMPYFNKAMEDIKKQDSKLFDWLNEIPPTSWSRSHFSCRAKCDILLNNICEVFNRQLVGARDKPIITCLEYIREYMTRRIVKVTKIQATSNGPLTPVAETMFNAIKVEASQLKVVMVDATKYQVSGITSQCVVNVHLKTCSCRRWELTGMPCKHAVAAIWNMSENNIPAGIPEAWVSEIGRPRKMRKKTVEEVQAGFSVGGKMTRKGTTNKCSKCGHMGHNCRSCKGQGGTQSQVEGVTQSEV
ncbi:hypothetical protein QVD17_39807 [Tagetes erecta]|uniref:SWIM-type domain-containing protein n=1 Tax=Tagetes erecta TaxID=13708 RepID=A0AAD8JP74_TARER|nr:hypothetical protein QVD17_39807 [Tagetes erecta]